MEPIAIDLFCGSFGWSAGWLELGGRVVGVDIDHQPYHGPVPRGADLILQDARTIHGAQFRNASLILASPPCQEYSYMAMPWKRAKQIAGALHGRYEFPQEYAGSRAISELTALFDACFRIQREASAAAGRHIPMVVENVRGAQPWVGQSRWSYGSFHLWGDVPALMPITFAGVKVGMGTSWYHPSDPRHVPGLGFNTHADRQMREADEGPKRILDDVRAGQRRVAGGVYDGETGRTTKNDGGSWFNVAHNTISGKGRNPDGRNLPRLCPTCCAPAITQGLAAPGETCEGCRFAGDGVRQPGISGDRDNGKGNAWFQDGNARYGSKSSARKAASARIAKIPLPLARHIARTYFPR